MKWISLFHLILLSPNSTLFNTRVVVLAFLFVFTCFRTVFCKRIIYSACWHLTYAAWLWEESTSFSHCMSWLVSVFDSGSESGTDALSLWTEAAGAIHASVMGFFFFFSLCVIRRVHFRWGLHSRTEKGDPWKRNYHSHNLPAIIGKVSKKEALWEILGLLQHI